MSIKYLISAKEKDLGGFSVRRFLPYREQMMVGPWIFFDHMGPAEFAPGLGINVRPHPHVNLATVTYLFDGQILHRDSLGNELPINPGDINLMVAGRGITHSERETEEAIAATRQLNGLQLWHALPKEFEEVSPAFHHYPADHIPTTSIGGAKIRVMMGEAFDQISPVKTFAETLYIEAAMAAEASLETPAVEQLAIYVVDGSVRVDGTNINAFEMAILEDNCRTEIKSNSNAQIALIGGESLGERFIDWNFVSSRKERIELAKQDWRNGAFAKVLNDEEEFIPLPE